MIDTNKSEALETEGTVVELGEPLLFSSARTPAKRGFKAMSEEQHKEICSKGGKTAHEKGTAYRFTPEKAREAAAKAVLKRRENAAAKLAAAEVVDSSDSTETI